MKKTNFVKSRHFRSAFICLTVIIVLTVISLFTLTAFNGNSDMKGHIATLRIKAENAVSYVKENIGITLPYENGDDAVLTVTLGKYNAYFQTEKAAILLNSLAAISSEEQEYLPKPLCELSVLISEKLTELAGILYHPDDAEFA